MSRRLGITPKLTLLFVLFAAVLLAGVGLLAYTSGRSALETATKSELLATALEKEAALNHWVAEKRLNIAALAKTPDLQAHVTAFMTDRNQATHDRLVQSLQAWVGPEGQYLGLVVIEAKTGRIVAATDPKQEGKFRENRPFFINGQKGPFIEDISYSLALHRPAMAAAAPLYDADGRLVGVLAGQLNLEEMNTIISRRTSLHQTDDAFLVNKAHLYVTQPRFITNTAVLQRGNQSEAVDTCLAEHSGIISAENYRGIPAITVYHWLPERQLCLIVKQDRAEALAPADAFGKTILLTGALALLTAGLLAVALARTITQPVLVLQRGAARFGQGDLSVRLPVKTTDELGELAHELNLMAAALSEKEAELRRHAEELEELVQARTAALIQSLHQEQAARTEVEQIREHLAFLAEASRVLASSLDYQTTLSTVSRLAVPEFADWCAVDVLAEDGALERVAVAHVDPEKVAYAYELQRRFPYDPSAPTGLAHVLRTGQPEFYPEIDEAMLAASGADEEALAVVRQLGFRSAMTVPLRTFEQVLGAITLVWAESGHNYSRADLDLVEELARRAGVAVENARLYREAQRLNIELEKRVQERTASLEAANRELEAFSYTVSHDLRSPLRAIDGFSRVLLEQYRPQLPAEAQRYLHMVRHGAQQMGQLIDDLLTFSRLHRQPVRREAVAPADLVRRALEELKPEWEGRQVEIILGDLPVCQADATLLKQVWFNLLSNALKYTRQREIARIEIGCRQVGEQLAYFVADNGVGFDMQYAHKLFGVFQRLHRAEEYEGTGVGLAIVQRIIHRHGGRIWAEAEIDKGATFYFTLIEGPYND